MEKWRKCMGISLSMVNLGPAFRQDTTIYIKFSEGTVKVFLVREQSTSILTVIVGLGLGISSPCQV